jgi:hypothetical protein
MTTDVYFGRKVAATAESVNLSEALSGGYY